MSTAMNRYLSAVPKQPPAAPPASAVATRGRHVAWLAAGTVVSFLVPFVFADQIGLQKDVYYGVYGLVVLGLFIGWARDTHQSLTDMCTRRWRLTLVLAAVFAAVTVLIALRAEDAGPTPEGISLAGSILWRGLFYGAIDGLLLSAFPILVVFAAFGGSRLRERRGGMVAIGAVALATSVLVTATYHLGYSDFRSSKVRKPMTGDLVWSVPTLVTLNPIGAPIAHAALHVTAVSHNSETDLFLPPH
jgi:hypothetical protein